VSALLNLFIFIIISEHLFDVLFCKHVIVAAESATNLNNGFFTLGYRFLNQ